jgi:hypothetical protein
MTVHSKIIHKERMWVKRIPYRISVGKTEGTRTLGKPRRKYEANIKMDFKELEWNGKD